MCELRRGHLLLDHRGFSGLDMPELRHRRLLADSGRRMLELRCRHLRSVDWRFGVRELPSREISVLDGRVLLVIVH